MRAHRQTRRRGVVLVSVLVLVTLLGLLSALLVRVIFSRSLLFGETQGRFEAQMATQGAFFMLKSCIDNTWNGDPLAFSAVFAACQSGLPPIAIKGRQYKFDISYSQADPYQIQVTALDAF